jgi:hypothetical protein
MKIKANEDERTDKAYKLIETASDCCKMVLPTVFCTFFKNARAVGKGFL